LEKLTQWHVLATIPTIDKASSNGKSKILNGRKPFQKEDFVKRGKISSLDPKSGIAESYRMLRTNLQFQGIGKDHKTILFTSIGPDEGKSTTLVNLAISIASLGQQVLVLDADLRKPILHAILGVDKEPGLSEILVNYSAMTEELPIVEAPKSLLGNLVKEPIGSLVDNFSDFILEEQFITKINNLKQTNNISILNSVLVESMQVTEIENLRILTSGKQLKNPSETISSVAMKSLIDELKQRYNIILIDSAPIMLVPETMILSALVDGVIFVVDAKKYNEEMLLKARNLLNKTKADVLGAVLNNVELGGIYKDNYYYHA
jgi:capsular exopolysaccharide synthesis family protein